MFVKEINKVIPENMKPLSASKVTQWLVSIGYLEEKERGEGQKIRGFTNCKTSLII